MSSNPTVFISYRRVLSEDLARYIHDRLRDEGVDVFYDLDDINAGERWRARLQRELVNRDVLLVILAPETLQDSEWVRREITTALEQNKTIIPVTHRGFQYSRAAIPDEIAGLGEFQGIPFEQRFADATIEQIKRALNITVNVTVQSSMPPQPKQGMSDTVKAAIIGGIFTVIVAVIALVPNLLQPSAGSTPTVAPTDIPASETPGPTNTLFPTETVLPPITPTEFIDLNATAIAEQQATIDTLNIQVQGSAAVPILTSTVPSTSTSTIAVITSTPGYPCEAVIVSGGRNVTALYEVRTKPELTAPLRYRVDVGQSIVILKSEFDQLSNKWYQIENSNRERGWILSQYISLGTTCPI
jgi:hypothetical protein